MAIDHSDPKYDTDPEFEANASNAVWGYYKQWTGQYLEQNAEGRAIGLVKSFEAILNEYAGLILPTLGYDRSEIKKLRCLTEFLRVRVDTDHHFLRNHYDRFVMLARKKQEYNFRVANFNAKKGSS
jgi:hypothetical protein